MPCKTTRIPACRIKVKLFSDMMEMRAMNPPNVRRHSIIDLSPYIRSKQRRANVCLSMNSSNEWQYLHRLHYYLTLWTSALLLPIAFWISSYCSQFPCCTHP
eukprot:m.56239 g.56239  ORF g.56239 m.56239 type:complete len:102 (+) comp7791_c0_seq3:485-790(+)